MKVISDLNVNYSMHPHYLGRTELRVHQESTQSFTMTVTDRYRYTLESESWTPCEFFDLHNIQ